MGASLRWTATEDDRTMPTPDAAPRDLGDEIRARFPFAAPERMAALAHDPRAIARYLARTHDLTPSEALDTLEIWAPASRG